MSRKILTLTKAEKALRENNGVILHAAEACGCTRQTFWKFMKENPHLYEIKGESEEELIDVAEGVMIQNIRGGDMKTIRWFLDRKGKNRGYSTRVEQTGKDGEPIEHDVNHTGFEDLAELLDGAARTRASGLADAEALADDSAPEPAPAD